jgi:hypothetical protein
VPLTSHRSKIQSGPHQYAVSLMQGQWASVSCPWIGCPRLTTTHTCLVASNHADGRSAGGVVSAARSAVPGRWGDRRRENFASPPVRRLPRRHAEPCAVHLLRYSFGTSSRLTCSRHAYQYLLVVWYRCQAVRPRRCSGPGQLPNYFPGGAAACRVPQPAALRKDRGVAIHMGIEATCVPVRLCHLRAQCPKLRASM